MNTLAVIEQDRAENRIFWTERARLSLCNYRRHAEQFGKASNYAKAARLAFRFHMRARRRLELWAVR